MAILTKNLKKKMSKKLNGDGDIDKIYEKNVILNKNDKENIGKSRKSGDLFEYKLAKYLTDKGLILDDEYTKNKYIKLKNNISKNDNINDVNNALDKICNILHFTNYKIIKFTKDNDGKNGTVSDIEIYNSDKNCIGFSCKVNNISIKHQRPSSLYIQSKMNSQNSNIFKQEYKICNDKWYNKLKNCITFNKIEDIDKMEMYKEINTVIFKYLKIMTYAEIKFYYNFLIHYEKVYVIKHDVIKKKLILYDYINKTQPSKILSIEIEKQYIYILFDNNIKIKLRLHNASKTITKSLSLKYDTTIIDGDLFTTSVFNC